LYFIKILLIALKINIGVTIGNIWRYIYTIFKTKKVPSRIK